jgi:hypothetical protein
MKVFSAWIVDKWIMHYHAESKMAAETCEKNGAVL